MTTATHRLKETDMENIIIASALALSLSACSTSPLRPADYADAASTAVAIAGGAVEMNPITSVLGDSMAAPVSLVASAGVRYAIDEYAPPEDREAYHRTFSTIKLAATCNNIGVLLGVEPVGLLVVAVTCGAVHHYATVPEEPS
jgi:hypothetical protein